MRYSLQAPLVPRGAKSASSTPRTLSGLTALLLSLSLDAAASAPEECRIIADDRTRLACYDALFLPLLWQPEEAGDSAGGPAADLLEEVARSEPQAAEAVVKARKRKFRYSLFDENFAIQPHRSTYLLPYSFTERANSSPFIDLLETGEESLNVEQQEVKFQISFKIPLATDVLLKDATLWGGYTQKSLWQMYNSDASSPFRETNYEPELFWEVPIGRELLSMSLETLSFGFNHQSNGRGLGLSRSWNRLFAELQVSHNRWTFQLRPWYRLPEDREDDDNPDIDDYLGYGDLGISYEWHPDLSLNTRLRHSFHSGNQHTSVNLGLVFPLPGPLNGYLEYVNGYGETLIDYNHRSKRIGIGVILNEWK